MSLVYLIVSDSVNVISKFSPIIKSLLGSADLVFSTIARAPYTKKLGMPIQLPFWPGVPCVYSDKVFLSENTRIFYLPSSLFVGLSNSPFESKLERNGKWLTDKKLDGVSDLSDLILSSLSIENENSVSNLTKTVEKNRLKLQYDFSEMFNDKIATEPAYFSDQNHFKTWESFTSRFGYQFFSPLNSSFLESIVNCFNRLNLPIVIKKINENLKVKLILDKEEVECYYNKYYSAHSSGKLEPQLLVADNFSPLNVRSAHSTMGFGDHFSRMDRLYDFLRFFTDVNFYVDDYRNPHNTTFDFLKYILIKANKWEFKQKIRLIEFEEFAFLFLSSEFNRVNDSEYVWSVYLGTGRTYLRELFKILSIEPKFIQEKVDFKFSNKIERSKENTVLNVVYHLRRHDTVGKAFAGILAEQDIKRFAAIREILTYELCDEMLKVYVEQLDFEVTKVNLTILSDGLSDLKGRLNVILPEIDSDTKLKCYDVIDSLDSDLRLGSSSLPYATIVERVVGRGDLETLKTMKAIGAADLVITSSSFSVLLARLAKADIISATRAIPLIGVNREVLQVVCRPSKDFSW